MAENGTTQVTIQGMAFKAPQPYAEGHTLNANEAATLNQTFVENLRNNFAVKIKDKKEAIAKEKSIDEKAVTNDMLDMVALQAEFDDYAGDYEFGVRKGGRVLDPVERELRSIGEEIIKTAIRAKGIKLNSVSSEQFDKFMSNLINAKPELRVEAERRVAATKMAAGVELEGLGV